MEFLYAQGLNPVEHAMPEEPLEVYREREYVCSVMPGGEVRFKERSEDAAAVMNFIEENYRNYILCEHLSGMPFDGIEDYKKFYEVGNSVLAARIMPDDRIEYVTWEYGYDRKGVMWGHYFGENFAAAKQDFAVRAGLIDSQKLFSDKQLSALHGACLFRLMNDMELPYEDEKELQTTVSRLEFLCPQLAEQPEPEAADENEFTEEV